jgi:RecA/RadA recombinase
LDKSKAIDAAVSQIERQFGKGSIMRMGDEERQSVPCIPTGALALDLALVTISKGTSGADDGTTARYRPP